jgi:hypothetical protein
MENLVKATTYSCVLALSMLLALGSSAEAQQSGMSFFVTSVGGGKGADLGGLQGGDQHCQKLAQAAGAGTRTWHAYLSTQASDGQPAANARDRIGRGPWQNAKGAVIAKDLDELHSDNNNLTKATALTERGDVVNGRGDTPNRHDALTGSQPDGRAFPTGEDRTCHNWTSSTQGAAMLGHIDRQGLRDGLSPRGLPPVVVRPPLVKPPSYEIDQLKPAIAARPASRANRETPWNKPASVLSPYISTSAPSSMTRSGGMRKNSVGRVAIRTRPEKSRSRHRAIPGRALDLMLARPTKKES